LDNAPTDINGWQVASDAGSITLTKGDEIVTATYGHDDHELALDHAVAQAWAIDNAEDAGRLAGGDPNLQWAAIVRWTGGKAGIRFGHAREGDIAAADAAAASTSEIAAASAPTENGAQ